MLDSTCKHAFTVQYTVQCTYTNDIVLMTDLDWC